ncbi:MAG: hypothetical protein SGJ27_31570 [Candidatus Melainabacteria bacterium]|nr:hypothetical protein [Candidatus Melainabacteria bacterium]
MKAIDLNNPIVSKTLKEIGVYLVAVSIVIFAFSRALNALSDVGKRTTDHTLSTDAVKQELAKLSGSTVALGDYLRVVDLLISHARVSEAQTLLVKRLNHIRTHNPKTAQLEEIVLLRRLARSHVKQMHFEDAQLIYQKAAQLAKTFDIADQQILIGSDLIDLYAQYTKFAPGDLQRKGAEKLFNKELEQLNRLAAAKQPDEKTQRLIHNRHRVGLIEMNRFLELDNFDPEPGANGRI